MLVIIKAKPSSKGNLKLMVESDGLENGRLELRIKEKMDIPMLSII
jgi:hypothetical protein